MNDDFMEIASTGLVPIEGGWMLDKTTGYRIDPEGRVYDGTECIYDPNDMDEEYPHG